MHEQPRIRRVQEALTLGVLLALLAPAVAIAAGRTATALPVAADRPTSPATGSTEGGRVVLINNADDGPHLETMNPDGTGVQRLNRARGFILHPAWTADGSAIIHITDADGPLQLSVIKADGTGQRTILADRPGWEAFTPTATPDGRRVIFTRCPPEGACSLYSVRFDGTGLTRLTHPTGSGGDFWPDVSPSGDRIAFSRYGEGGIALRTWVMKADGSGAHPITAPALEAGLPRWLPDGERMLLISQWVRLGSQVVSVGADGSGVQVLTSAPWPHSAAYGTPSPSGRTILFTNDTAIPGVIGFDVLLMRADGSGKHRVRRGAFYNPDWSGAAVAAPDGPAVSVPSGPSGSSGSSGSPLPEPAALARHSIALRPGLGGVGGHVR